MDFVRDICDRLALMRGGKILQIGRTAEILAQGSMRKRVKTENRKESSSV
jgi:methyl coenzyme M reductase system subunit A2